VLDVIEGRPLDQDITKALIVDAVTVIDVFLLGTVLYIISAGLYQLFIDHALELPRWLLIESLDDLKVRLTGVIVVGLLVAFLGYVIEWKGGLDLLAPGLGIAAIVVAAGLYFRLTHHPGPAHGLGGPGSGVSRWTPPSAGRSSAGAAAGPGDDGSA
jgi:uncharacterized membrane protein YqhA